VCGPKGSTLSFCGLFLRVMEDGRWTVRGSMAILLACFTKPPLRPPPGCCCSCFSSLPSRAPWPPACRLWLLAAGNAPPLPCGSTGMAEGAGGGGGGGGGGGKGGGGGGGWGRGEEGAEEGGVALNSRASA